jgi:hypothetical protein
MTIETEKLIDDSRLVNRSTAPKSAIAMSSRLVQPGFSARRMSIDHQRNKPQRRRFGEVLAGLGG